MNKEICEIVLEHRNQLVPALFTERQVNIVQKYLNHQKLTPGERTYFYSAIRRKMEALRSLREEYYITGEGMRPERVEKAKQILKELNFGKAFISGSFLYKKEYNDIDIFVISNRRKSYRREHIHFTHILEKDLQRPLFVSIAKYSVSTSPLKIQPSRRREQFDDLLFLYQWVINQILENEDQKEIRDLLLSYSVHLKQDIPDARSLDYQTQEIKSLSKNSRIKKINWLVGKILLKIYSPRYLYSALSRFIKNITEMGRDYRTKNIPILLNFAKEVRHECRRTAE